MANTNDGFIYNDIYVNKDDFDRLKGTDIWDYLGDNIYNDSLVVYIPKREYFGKHRKNIWKVKNINGKAVRVKNIANGDVFTTTLENLLSVGILESWGYITDEYISKASLNEYKKYDDEEEEHFNAKRAGNYMELKRARFRQMHSREETKVTASPYIPTSADLKTTAERMAGRIDADILSGITASTIVGTDLKINLTERKENTMNNIKNRANRVIDNNVSVARDAAAVAAGKALNRVVKDQLRPQLPMLARGYADHVLADVVVANIANFAVENFMPTNRKARMATDAMMKAAMIDFVASFNFEQIVTDVLANANINDAAFSED